MPNIDVVTIVAGAKGDKRVVSGPEPGARGHRRPVGP